MAESAKTVQIDSVSYPLFTDDRRTPAWSVVEQGEKVEWERKFGFLGGMGAYISRRPDDYLMLRNMDALTSPYLRLHPGKTQIDLVGLAVLARLPIYVITAQDSSGNNYAYLLTSRNAWKIDLSDNSTGTVKDFGANAICGRPAFFKGKWHIPLGASVDYVTLDSVAVGDAADSDTWTTVTNEKALHFATTQKDIQEMLARAYSTNLIDLSADGTTWNGDDFEVPTSAAISDLLSAQGELIVCSAESIFMMSEAGKAVRILQTISTGMAGGDVATDHLGSNSAQHGAYTYYPHPSGLWRFIGQVAQDTIGPEQENQFVNRALDGFQVFTTPSVGWNSVAPWGKWIYATFEDHLFSGKIRDDGRVTWHGATWVESSSFPIRCFVNEGPGVAAVPILWVAVTVSGVGIALNRFNLAQDGSLKDDLGTARGSSSTTHQAWFGEQRGRRKTQWRVMGVEVEGSSGATMPIRLSAHMDGAATATSIGSTITATGRHERAWTVGTNDFANFIIPTLDIITTGGFSASDPRIRTVFGWGLTPHVYRCVIDLRPDELAERAPQHDFQGALKLLRNMVNGPAVTIIEPDTEESFSGYIEGISEVSQDGGRIVTLFISTYEWYTS